MEFHSAELKLKGVCINNPKINRVLLSIQVTMFFLFVCSFVRLFVCSFVRLFVCSFVRSIFFTSSVSFRKVSF